MTVEEQVRAAFRRAVFGRAGYKCEVCGCPGHDPHDGAGPGDRLDAHHITDRHDMPNGGYVAANGIALCEACHWEAEGAELPGFVAADLYKRIGSSHAAAVAASEGLS